MALAHDIEAAIELLGGPKDDPVVDFLLDPGAACRALDALPEHGGLVIRVAPEPAAGGAGYGPVPVDPVWVRVMRGAREVGTALYHGGDGMVRKATRIDLDERDEPCCESSGCERRRKHASVWLVLEGMSGARPERLLVAEQRLLEGAPDVARGIAARLAKAIDVPIERAGEVVSLDVEDPPAPLGDALANAALARFALRTEGDRVILRDWDNAGPRATAKRNTMIGVVLMIAAAAAWIGLWQALAAGGAQGAAIGAGIAGALLTLTGYAFLGVARYSAKYRASSAPLAAVGSDRIIILPWVGRDGAVDVRPEGRFGAAIPLVEVRASSAARISSGVAVRLDTDHGPIDVMICENEAAANLWCKALDRTVDEARHPRAGASARQRARARQTATA
ncbi:Hypothetical protein A7982_04308 [Minicystis rosea]|nr:Hypothetical protein A7982_04308 [Minicystis rosea]